jgi:2-keto-4-pentenoate hydratase
MIPALIEQLPAFTVKLSKNGAVAAEGSGKNVLRSPALCLAEFASASARQQDAEPLGADELVSTGTLAEPQRLGTGEVWTASVEGLDLPPLTLRT